MKPLSEKEAELLLALPDDAERLKWFTDKAALQTALGLTEGTAVIVEEGGEELKGIIRYIGELTTPTYRDPLSGTFFGIELQVKCQPKKQKHIFLLSLTETGFEASTSEKWRMN